ncbi:MAG: tail fiber protein [Pseudomonadota bacterium]
MSEPFVGEIRMFAGNFAPRGWAFCDGQLIATAQNDALFSLFGTVYGGDGRTTFGLPDMRGRIPVHAGTGPGLSSRRLGIKGGAETVTLNAINLPAHSHSQFAETSDADQTTPTDHMLGKTGSGNPYYVGDLSQDLTAMNISTLQNAGGSNAHTNLMPYLCVNFIVSLFGIYPSRT